MRSSGAICSANARRRSFRPISSKPWSRVAAKFSGEPVSTQVWGAVSGTRAIVGGVRALGDRDVLDLDRRLAAQLQAVEVPVDQCPREQQQLTYELGELVGQLTRDQPAHHLDQPHQGLELARRLVALAGARHRV